MRFPEKAAEASSRVTIRQIRTYGSFRKFGVPYFGVLIIRILLFRYYIRVPYFRKLQYESPNKGVLTMTMGFFGNVIMQLYYNVTTTIIGTVTCSYC